jgi:hypothetical protein
MQIKKTFIILMISLTFNMGASQVQGVLLGTGIFSIISVGLYRLFNIDNLSSKELLAPSTSMKDLCPVAYKQLMSDLSRIKYENDELCENMMIKDQVNFGLSYSQAKETVDSRSRGKDSYYETKRRRIMYRFEQYCQAEQGKSRDKRIPKLPVKKPKKKN